MRPTDTLEQLRARLLDLQSRMLALDLDQYKKDQPTYPAEPEDGEEMR